MNKMIFGTFLVTDMVFLPTMETVLTNIISQFHGAKATAMAYFTFNFEWSRY